MSKVRDIIDNIGGASTSPVVTNADTDVNATATTIPVRDTDTAISGKNQCTTWVNFDGTNGAIRDSYNVASVVRNGSGDYTINFLVPMTAVNYSVVGACNYKSGYAANVMCDTFTTSSVKVYNWYGAGGDSTDTTIMCISIFGGK